MGILGGREVIPWLPRNDEIDGATVKAATHLEIPNFQGVGCWVCPLQFAG